MKNRAIVCPITGTDKGYPIQPSLDERTKTKGVVLCDQVMTLDLKARHVKYIEKAPDDILYEIVDIVYGMIET